MSLPFKNHVFGPRASSLSIWVYYSHQRNWRLIHHMFLKTISWTAQWCSSLFPWRKLWTLERYQMAAGPWMELDSFPFVSFPKWVWAKGMDFWCLSNGRWRLLLRMSWDPPSFGLQFCGSCYYFLKSVFLSFPLPNTLLWRKRDYEAAAVNLHGILLLNPGLCPCVTSLQKKPDMEWERRQITAPAFGWKETNERNHMAQDWLTHDCFWNLDVIPLQPWIFLCLAVNPKTSKTIGWKRFLMAGNRSCGWPKINSW